MSEAYSRAAFLISEGMRRRGMDRNDLAKEIHVAERTVRNMTSMEHHVDMQTIDDALAAVGACMTLGAIKRGPRVETSAYSGPDRRTPGERRKADGSDGGRVAGNADREA